MANGFVQLPDDAANTGKKEDHFVIANGNYREAVVIGDPTTTAAVAPVSATLGLGVNILDGSDVTLGAIADANVVGDNTGTISAKLRGLNRILNDVWDSASHFLKVSIQNATLAVVGNIAHDSADSGNPVKIGFKAISYGANPTGVTANDRTDAYSNIAGIPFMLGGHPNIITRRDNYTSTNTDAAIITISGGTKIVVVACTVAADAANTAKPAVRIGFGTANTPTGAGTYLSHPGVPAGGGIREAGAVAGADGEDLRITSAIPTGGSIDVVTKYFTIES